MENSPFPQRKLYTEFPTPPAVQSGKSPAFSLGRGGDSGFHLVDPLFETVFCIVFLGNDMFISDQNANAFFHSLGNPKGSTLDHFLCLKYLS